jgi:uncharacterized protein YjbI with pentapeptide repeats
MSRKNLIRTVLILLTGLFALIAALGISRYPTRQASDLRRQIAADRDLQFDKRAQLETTLLQYETDNRIKIWTAIVQAAGGAALLTGLLFTARNLRATQDKLDIDRQGQLTNRFIQATGQLGAELKDGQPNVEVRLGGIYALNRISKDWPKDYWPIADVLTAYVRHNARWTSCAGEGDELTPRTDIQAILTVLGHSDPPGGFNKDNKLDLRNTDLRGAEFYNVHLEWTDFWGAHLDGAQFWGAVLRNAKLERAHLNRANLRAAKLEGASLENADVTEAIFDRETVWPAGFDPRGRGAVFIEEGA